MSSRSRGKESKLSALEELKRTRAGGKRVLKEEDNQIYDEISEDEYRDIVKGRLARDDFVVEDGEGDSGYIDNGQDDWMETRMDASDEDSDRGKKKSVKKNGKTKAAKPKAKPQPAPTPAAPSIAAYRPQVSAAQEEDFMANLLGTLDKAPVVPKSTAKTRKRKTSPQLSSDIESSPSKDFSSHPPSDDYFMSPKKKPRVNDAGMTPTIERLADLDVQTSSDFESGTDIVDYDDFFDNDDDILMDIDELPKVGVKPEPEELKLPKKAPRAPPAAVKKEEADTKPAWLSIYDSLSVSKDDGSLGSLQSNSAVKGSNIDALEPDGSLRFYWLDYLEHDGRLYLIGKLKDKKTQAWMSCCITVDGLERNLYALPRERRIDYDEDAGEVTELDEVPNDADVHADFDELRKNLKIKTFKSKFVERSYCFGERDIPRGKTRWMKIVYPFTQPQVPMGVWSPNISHILGTNTSAFELFVLKRKIMGPCWLEVKNPQVEFKGVSWCHFEASVNDPKDVNPIVESLEQPPLTILSLSVRTIVNHQQNKREVVCASTRTWQNIQIDDGTPPEKLPCTVQTFIRPLDRYPPGFEAQAKSNTRGQISTAQNERMLLSVLLGAINKSDPDIIIGHEFLGVSLDVLLHRMRDLKVDHWSRLGRFRRSKWPNIGKQGSNVKFLNGRLVCDLASDAGKSTISSTTWSLTEMCSTQLGLERQDIDPDDTANYLDGSLSGGAKMMTFLQHCELDAHYQMAIAAKVQILPLTCQLTALAGNSWNKTLNGGRAERNEYILLHEFHRLKYICPDKTFGKKSVPKSIPEDEEGGGGGDGSTKTKAKRDKYKGGLVFEPKRGLWDTYILVMDFNSLYPSIIQEYNIDFTTVESVEEDESGEGKIPDPPPKQDLGVLPRLIANLVNRRKQVKSLMKDKNATSAKILQYDIKQQALKLTANSMYGCLGFEYSRFYARPLAALTTFKGREILTRTRELAESLNLDVVYGDTDSVFVNSGVSDFAEALKISATFKKAVNDQYKLLEIDLDGVFQRLLLLQKKKYAALKVEDGTKTSVEVKGLDMKRREYCALSKDVSQYVLGRILSGDSTEDVVETIHEYLTTLAQSVRNGQIKPEDFIIFKRLGKNPEDYPDAKSQPHVQVALRMKAKGQSARSGDVISYIFCAGKTEGDDAAKGSQADRAMHPDEVRRGGTDVKIDYEYYLAHQILPPIERLCDAIEGTDRARLAECLGLDPNRYRNTTASEEKLFASLDSQMSDVERFKETDPFKVRCRWCHATLNFPVLNDRSVALLKASGVSCLSCEKPITGASLQVQLEGQIRAHIAKYYEGWAVCDEQTCSNRTRSMGIYGRRCLKAGCKGRVSFEYSDTKLYNQLRYYKYLFDKEKAINASKNSPTQEEVLAVVGTQSQLLSNLNDLVEKYLQQCGRRWVDLNSIFSVLKLT
ncbi:DNA polymerase alpha catalytic subunit [Coprinopsis marcescibilis]|uniref:DNA polymerase n=1 Tax=Coprinopsis marcescibilis TaxID=230819 RepID=A0A5C3KRH5_COPMA|nr:DNA polymerase alpha catalytic subunit [Coprinopsis marcescibilis]